jgi:hypothetical protein
MPRINSSFSCTGCTFCKKHFRTIQVNMFNFLTVRLQT